MRVKWNRNLDGVHRPLITVPESDIITNGSSCVSTLVDNSVAQLDKNSLIDLNDNSINNSNVTNDSERMNNSNSPCPSSASICSKRSDKSKTKITALFNFFKLRDKVLAGDEDCNSNYSELSNTTTQVVNTPYRMSPIGRRIRPIDPQLFECHDKFETDSRRRRRANTLLMRTALRRSWHQLNSHNKLTSGYIISKEPYFLNNSVHSHSPLLTMRRKCSEPEIFLSNGAQNRTDWPQVNTDLKRNDSKGVDEVNKTKVNLNSDLKTAIIDNIEEISGKSMLTADTKSDAPNLEHIDLKHLNLNETVICGSDCDKVQNFTTELSDFTQNLSHNLENVADLKNNCDKNNIKAYKQSLEKNTCTVNCAPQPNPQKEYYISSDSLNLNLIKNEQQLSIDQTTTEKELFTDSTDSSNHVISNSESKSDSNDNNDISQMEIKNLGLDSNIETEIINDSAMKIEIVKVKVKKTVLPDTEVVSFSPQIACSPNNTSINSSEAVYVTFVNDEPMTMEEALEESTASVCNNDTTIKDDSCVKPLPIHGILRLRNRKDLNSDDNISATKLSQKKVHFADNNLHSRCAVSRGIRRPAKSRHGVQSITDKKTIPRRTTAAVTVTVNNSLPQSKRVPTYKTSSYIAKKDTRCAQIVDEKKQIQKLTELCEHKTKQLKAQSLNENYLKLAFDSLSVVIRHLTEQYGAFENPELRQSLKNANKRCEQLKDSLEIAKLEMNDMKIIYEEQINQLMKEREKYYSDLNQAKVNHESYIRNLVEMHSWEKTTIEDKHKKEMQLCQQTRQKLFNDIEVKNNEIEETKQLRELLEVKVHKLEENIMKDKDKKCKYLSDKIKQLDLEVDSLRAVMDMKNEKIHKLEAEMTETKDVMTELPMAKETIKGLQQQIENLKITLERKILQFNQLVRQHEDLKNEYDREMREKRRLSMKNEELQYTLSESYNENFSYFGANYDMTPIPVKKLHTDETPIRPTNRTYSSMSASNLNKNHTKPMSASVNSSLKRGMNQMPNFYGTNAINDKSFDNCFLTDVISDDNVFEASVSKCSSPKELNCAKDSNRKSTASFKYAKSVETHTSPSILDSGFEEFQGLSSFTNNK